MQQGTPYSSPAQSEAWHWKSEYLGRTFRSPFGGLHLNLECKELTLLPSPTSCPPTTCSSFTFLFSLSYADWRHWRCYIRTYSMQCTINRLSQQVSTLLYLQCYILGSHGRLWCQPDQSARMCLTDWSAEWERSLTVSQTGTLCAGQDRQSSSGQHQHTTPPRWCNARHHSPPTDISQWCCWVCYISDNQVGHITSLCHPHKVNVKNVVLPVQHIII